jgi:hypothetical protein
VSLHEYQRSQQLVATGTSFDALIMAALRAADPTSERVLAATFPDVWRELYARDNAPGGRLLSDRPDVLSPTFVRDFWLGVAEHSHDV